MSLFSSVVDLASDIASMVPGYGTIAAKAIDLFGDVVNKVAPMVSSAVDNSTLPDSAKSTFNDAYNLVLG